MADQLEAIEIETTVSPIASIIWMHGLGADGHDFVDIVPELGLPARPGVRFVFPHAPMRPVTINGGYVMRAWYDIRDAGGVRREDPAGVRASQKSIEALIQREKERGVPASAIVLAGFSQGGAMALHTGLRHGERLAGVMALSCSLPLADTLAVEAAPANDPDGSRAARAGDAHGARLSCGMARVLDAAFRVPGGDSRHRHLARPGSRYGDPDSLTEHAYGG